MHPKSKTSCVNMKNLNHRRTRRQAHGALMPLLCGSWFHMKIKDKNKQPGPFLQLQKEKGSIKHSWAVKATGL